MMAVIDVTAAAAAAAGRTFLRRAPLRTELQYYNPSVEMTYFPRSPARSLRCNIYNVMVTKTPGRKNQSALCKETVSFFRLAVNHTLGFTRRGGGLNEVVLGYQLI